MQLAGAIPCQATSTLAKLCASDMMVSCNMTASSPAQCRGSLQRPCCISMDSHTNSFSVISLASVQLHHLPPADGRPLHKALGKSFQGDSTSTCGATSRSQTEVIRAAKDFRQPLHSFRATAAVSSVHLAVCLTGNY